jgi:hypothetical protein
MIAAAMSGACDWEFREPTLSRGVLEDLAHGFLQRAGEFRPYVA